jgi:hypothetical protein
MSKVVKKVTRAVTNVVKGVVKVVQAVQKPVVSAVKKVASKVVEVVKKVAKSKLGKAVLIAAAVYFGGAALAGGFSSSAAGGSFLSGMGTGVSNAASSLSNAWTSVLKGNFSQAGRAISSGFQGQMASAGASAASAMPAVAEPYLTATTPGAPGAVIPPPTLPPPSGSPGTLGKAWNSLGDYGKMAAVQGSTAIVGNLISGEGQQQQADDARDRYNTNVGTNWWGGGADTSQPSYGSDGLVRDTMYRGPSATPYPVSPPPQAYPPSGPAPGQSYKDYMDNMMKTYDPYALPQR